MRLCICASICTALRLLQKTDPKWLDCFQAVHSVLQEFWILLPLHNHSPTNSGLSRLCTHRIHLLVTDEQTNPPDHRPAYQDRDRPPPAPA